MQAGDLIADTGSPTKFVNQKTANQIMTIVKSTKRIKTNDNDGANRMICYNGYKIQLFGRVIAPLESGGWTINTASLIVVDDRRAIIMGRNLLALIGAQLQQQPAGMSVNTISDDVNRSDAKITNWAKSTYPGLCTRIGRARNHMVHTTFLQELKALQQTGQSIPIHNQEKLEQEIRSLIDQVHIIKLEKCSDQPFISTIVIKVKKDHSIKLAMDSEQINKLIQKNKYQMPKIDVLLDNVAQSAQEGHNKPGITLISTIDLRYWMLRIWRYLSKKVSSAAKRSSGWIMS